MVVTTGKKGVWEPLPLIYYGYAVHPLSQSRRDTRRDTRCSNRTRLSTFTDVSGTTDDHLTHRDVVTLEVGDEVYAFERYTPKAKEVEGIWYRGYVVCTSRRPTINWSADPSSSKAPAKSEELQVFIGIFPASHIYIRDELADAEGHLAAVAGRFSGYAAGSYPSGGVEAAKNEEEDPDTLSIARKSFKVGPRPDQANSSRAALPVYPPSLRSSSPAESQAQKPLPPRPSLKSGDETASGAVQPIIDEIASALREWHALMFQYLFRRDYHLFHLVREHIEALHLGRRQLLVQTLSSEETVNLRRECVVRLVGGNVIQGLDVIVRHPTWGALVTTDVEGEMDPRSWVSPVRMYAMQTSLAYMDPMSSPGIPKAPSASAVDYSSSFGPIPTPAHSAFPEFLRTRGIPRGYGSFNLPVPAPSGKARFYHVFLDLRAFVASPCSPGETAELFFSLYNKTEGRFLTEEFSAFLNQNGVLARDPTARIRSLFTDLVQSDVQEPIYLVCRIVRNGALKIGNSISSSGADGRRGSDVSFRERDSSAGGGWDPSASSLALITPVSALSTRSQFLDNTTNFRRPFGCAVLELSQLSQLAQDQNDISATREHTMPIYVPTNETIFSMLHQDIIMNNFKEFEKSPRAEMIAVSVKIFRGDADMIMRENTSLLQDSSITRRLSFPDVVFPGDVRNDMYIKLWSGDFASSNINQTRRSVANLARGQVGSSSSAIQVTMEVRDHEGKSVEPILSPGSGEPLMSQFNSMVFLRNTQPTFGELVKLSLPIDGITRWHVFFTFRHRNSREKVARSPSDNPDRPFAFGFLPLFPDGRAALEDGSHTMVLYRADRLSQITPEMYLEATPSFPSGQKLDHIVVPPDLQRLAPITKDTMTIRSSLCSTKYTQNPVLLNLLYWEQITDKDLLSTVLTKFTFVGEVEIVKFLSDIFDALFGILVSSNNPTGEMDLLVFNALVTVLGIVQDRRFNNFQPVLDVYIEKHFSCASASSHIIHSISRLLANPTAPETASSLRAALKVWHYIFKFITQSRELQKREEMRIAGANAEHFEATFRRELRTHLAEVNRMMSTTTPASIIGTQTIALQHFTSVLPELEKIFPINELVSHVRTFANAIVTGKGKIVVIRKLIMFLQVVKGFLFDNPQSRTLLLEAVVIWIKPHFGRFDEYLHTQPGDSDSAKDAARVSWMENIRLCVTIIAVMLDKLCDSLVEPSVQADRVLLHKEQDNVDYLLSLLPRLVESYIEFQSAASQRALEHNISTMPPPSVVPVTFPESYPFPLLAHLPKSPSNASASGDMSSLFNPGLGETAVIFLVLVSMSSKKQLLDFLESSFEIEGRENFSNLLTQFFKVASSILDNDAFPSSWLNINILAHKVLVKFMDPVATLLEREFIPGPHGEYVFDVNLWTEGFSMLLKLLSSDQLVIEEFSPQKRRAVWRLAHDIRGEGAAILLRLWSAICLPEDVPIDPATIARYGGYQVSLGSLVGQVVDLCLSHHDQLRNNAVHILYNMIVSEFHISQHFDHIENELVSKLDQLFMSDSKGDDISRAFFIGPLRHLFESSNVDESLRDRVGNFLDSVDLFLELLLSVRALPEGEEFADDRVIATLRLMNFIRKIGRDEIYIKYVHQLVNMHLQSQNYVEAALTLKLHSDLHEWDLHSFVEPMEDLGLPQQSQFHRKETLCLLILDYLGKGKAWESAIEICKELAFQHAEVTFNYARLAEILRHQAELLDHIVMDHRYYSDYFRVAFYGNFPVAIRNKQFIYRGFEWEKFGPFCERMLNKHPGARLLKTMGDPPPDIRFGTDQYIQCTAVTPEPNRSLPIFSNVDVPLAVRTYYEHSAINYFSCPRPVDRVTRDGTEEAWLEKTYFTTEESFPTVLRRSEIVAVQIVEISPIERALQEVEQRTKELVNLHFKYSMLAKTGQIGSVNPLTMALNAAVDSSLDSGVPSFRYFLSNDYIVRNSDKSESPELIERLRIAIDDQVRMIDSCLRLHGQICTHEMLVVHEGTLEKFFRKNFSEEIRRLQVEGSIVELSQSPSIRSVPATAVTGSQYQASLYEHSLNRSISTTSTSRPQQYVQGHPLQLTRPAMTPPPMSPMTLPHETINGPGKGQSPTQTPLQRHLAHLVRHGLPSVSSRPQTGGSDSFSGGSPPASIVVGSAPTTASITSGTGATSAGSTRARWSARLGGFTFGRG